VHKRAQSVRLLRESQFTIIAAKQKKSRTRFQQVSAQSQGAHRQLNTDTRQSHSESNIQQALPQNPDMRKDNQPCTSRGDNHAPHPQSADVAVRADDQTAMDTGTSLPSATHNTQRKLTPWPPNVRTWHRADTNANTRYRYSAPIRERSGESAHFHNQRPSYGQRAATSNTGRPTYRYQQASAYGGFRHNSPRSSWTPNWHDSIYGGYNRFDTNRYKNTSGRYDARNHVTHYVSDERGYYRDKQFRRPSYYSLDARRTHATTTPFDRSYGNPNSTTYYGAARREWIPAYESYHLYGGYSW
jgi:hypothetical protein